MPILCTLFLKRLADVKQHHRCTPVHLHQASYQSSSVQEALAGQARTVTSRKALYRDRSDNRLRILSPAVFANTTFLLPLQKFADTAQAETSVTPSGSKCNRFSLYRWKDRAHTSDFLPKVPATRLLYKNANGALYRLHARVQPVQGPNACSVPHSVPCHVRAVS